MITLANILYIAGYTFDFENNIYIPPLDIEVGRHNTFVAIPRSKKKESYKRMIITTIYKIMIYFIILWLVPYTLYMAIRDKNGYIFGRSWFQILYAVQYYYASSYFSENHFYENILCNEKLKKYMNIASPCLLLFSISLGIINVCLLNTGYRYIGYDEIYKLSTISGKVLISILIFLDSFYSYITFLINSYVFAINMIHHKVTVSTYAESLDNYVKSVDVIRIINIVATEFSQMKNTFAHTVELLTPFFSVLNFVGFITVYFYLNTIKNNDLGISEYINLILFLIIEAIYIQSIQSVNDNIQKISDTITSNSMIITFFGNKKSDKIMPVIDQILVPQKKSDIISNISNLNIQRHNNDTSTKKIEYKIPTNHISSIEMTESNTNDNTDSDNIILESRRIPGIPETSGISGISESSSSEKLKINELSKQNKMSGLLDTGININSGIETDRKEYFRYLQPNISARNKIELSDKNPVLSNLDNMNISEAYLSENITIAKQNLIASISTEQMIEWLILGNIISTRWKTFTMFGIEFTDTTLLSKLFGVGTAILVTDQFGSLLAWW